MDKILGKPVDVARFLPFQPCEILYEFDGPRIFTIQDSEGELNLAYWSDEDHDSRRFVVVPTTENILKALRSGASSVFEALNQPRCWLCDESHSGDLLACIRVDFESIPPDSLPQRGTSLWPALESRQIDVEGRIRELDKDRLSFELREIKGPATSQRFVFNQDLLANISQAFGDDVRVKVAGRTNPVKNLAQAVAVSRVS